jgi:hypothetical protein
MKWLKKPLPAAVILVLVWGMLRFAFLWHTGFPRPLIHDEFSYLLEADTFAHGRLANPPHPLAKFFESPNLLMHPTYASKYPPGQAMFLALGQRLFGSAFYGVLIGNALMLFIFCLMLFTWVPPQWALAVSAMFGVILSGRMYWTFSYWGGSVAACGGALVLFALGIYRARQTPLAGVLFAIGVLLLFWTRPFEGGVFTLAVMLVFAKDLLRTLRVGVLAATVSVLAIGVAWTCYDNLAITGNPFLLPHLLHQRRYDVAPVFWSLPLLPEPAYSHPRLASLYGKDGYEVSVYKEQGPRWQSLWIGLVATLKKLELSLVLIVLLTLLVPVAWRDPLYRRMAIVAGVVLLAVTVETFHFEHYYAPAWAALALMIAVWAERAWNLRIRNFRVGAALVLLALLTPVIIILPPHVSRLLEKTGMPLRGDSQSRAASAGDWSMRRAELIERLSKLDRRQLVIVRYPSPDWNIHEEWVYNSANIDQQRVVFAHDLGMKQNRALLDYYPDRTALLLTFDSLSGEDKIEPYPLTPAP